MSLEQLKKDTFNQMCNRGEIATNSDNEKWVDELIQIGVNFQNESIKSLIDENHSKTEWYKAKIRKGFSFENSLPNFAECRKASYTGRILVYTKIENKLINILNKAK